MDLRLVRVLCEQVFTTEGCPEASRGAKDLGMHMIWILENPTMQFRNKEQKNRWPDPTLARCQILLPQHVNGSP